MQQLCEAGEEEFLEIMALVGMASKPLHVRRLQKALQEWVANPREFTDSNPSPSACSNSVNTLLTSITGGNTGGSPLNRGVQPPFIPPAFCLQNASSSPDSSSKTLSIDSDCNFDVAGYKDNRQTVIKESVPFLDQSSDWSRRNSPDNDVRLNDISRQKLPSELSDRFHGVTVKEEPDLTVILDSETTITPIPMESFDSKSQNSNITQNSGNRINKSFIRNLSPNNFYAGQHRESLVKNDLSDNSFVENLKTRAVSLRDSRENFEDPHSTRYPQSDAVNDRLGMGVNYIGQPYVPHRYDESAPYRNRRREHVITSKDCKESTDQKTDWSKFKVASDSAAGRRNVRVERVGLGQSTHTIKRMRSSEYEDRVSPVSRHRSSQPPGLTDINIGNKNLSELLLSNYKIIGNFISKRSE